MVVVGEDDIAFTFHFRSLVCLPGLNCNIKAVFAHVLHTNIVKNSFNLGHEKLQKVIWVIPTSLFTLCQSILDHSAHYHFPMYHAVVCWSVFLLFAHTIFRHASYWGHFHIQFLTHSEECRVRLSKLFRCYLAPGYIARKFWLYGQKCLAI